MIKTYIRKRDFTLSDVCLPEELPLAKFCIGKTYANSLTGFLAGIIVGLLAAYILLSLYV